MAGIRKPQYDFGEKKTTTGKPKCHLCSLNHPLKYCRTFKGMSPTLRRLSILNKGYCLNCLAFDHVRHWCPSRARCQFPLPPDKYCNARHHTLLHRDATGVLSSSFEDDTSPMPYSLSDSSEDDGSGIAPGLPGVYYGGFDQGDRTDHYGSDSDESGPPQGIPGSNRFAEPSP